MRPPPRTHLSWLRKSVARKMLLLCTICHFLSSDVSAQIAVIVNATNPVESVSAADLKRIFLGQITTWEFGGGTKGTINLIDYRGKEEISETFYQTVAGTSPIIIRMKWLSMILNGEFQTLPVSMESERKMLEYIADNPSAIGFMSLADLDHSLKTIKVLKIDGNEVSDTQYPLRLSGKPTP